MNTDETKTDDEASAPEKADEAQAAAPERTPDATDEPNEASPGNEAAAASAWSGGDGDVEEEEGDDVGNRLPGAPHVRPVVFKPGDPRAPKKKRRRRRKKPSDQAGASPNPEAAANEAAGVEGDETESEGAESEPEGDASADGAADGGEKKRRGKKHKHSDRERPAFSIGEEVFGKVSKIADDAVWVDIAGKAVGLFDRRELAEGEELPGEGDQFIATVASTGVRGGMLMLSRAPTKIEDARAKVEVASESGELVEGFVTGVVKGGLEVDIEGVRAFAPASHVDLHHGADLTPLVGKRLAFSVAQYAKKGRDVVVSRKKMLDEERGKMKSEALSKLEPGSVHKGVVRKVVQWGAFVALPDADNVEGLVHMTEASHDRGARLADLFKVGDAIDVKVMRVDEKGKLWLSHKATIVDPWEAVKEKYKVGSRHKAKVARLQPFGAFIELEPGIDGLIHTADLSLKPIDHPQEVVKVGDEIEVVVASCDPGSHRIGLHPAPPESEANEPRQKIAPHKAVKVVVAQITEGGLVVRVLGVTGRSARAFIPAGHTGTPRGTDLRKTFPVGTQLEAKVLEIDPRRGEAKLSVRALKEDAEKQAFQQYRAGVAREAKFGTFGDLLKQKLGQG